MSIRTPDTSSHTPTDPHPTGVEFLLEVAGIGFEVIHEGLGSACDACPQGFDLAA
jgi:hypothetical protein